MENVQEEFIQLINASTAVEESGDDDETEIKSQNYNVLITVVTNWILVLGMFVANRIEEVMEGQQKLYFTGCPEIAMRYCRSPEPPHLLTRAEWSRSPGSHAPPAWADHTPEWLRLITVDVECLNASGCSKEKNGEIDEDCRRIIQKYKTERRFKPAVDSTLASAWLMSRSAVVTSLDILKSFQSGAPTLIPTLTVFQSRLSLLGVMKNE